MFESYFHVTKSIGDPIQIEIESKSEISSAVSCVSISICGRYATTGIVQYIYLIVNKESY